jgi:outer membrane protein assembly factor BamD
MKPKPAILLLALLLSACAHHGGVKVIPIYSAEEEYGHAKRLFERKKYGDAFTVFQQFVYNHEGSSLMPDAVFYEGESKFLDRDYSGAVEFFEEVVSKYPTAAYADRAQYRLGLCYYKESPSWELDQEMTEKAIEAFQIFLVKYPQSPLVPDVNRMIYACQGKLANKRYDSGRIYLTLRLYDSARVYFKSTQEDFPNSFWSREAAFGLAECDFLQKNYREAQKGYEALLKGPDDKLSKRAKVRLRDIARRLEKEASQTKK